MMAGETATGPRTVFAAVVAFTGQSDRNGWVLVRPEGFRCPRAETVPVFGWASRGDAVQVGEISEAYVVDGRVIVFGHLSTGPVARECASRLAAGTHFLQIEVDKAQTDTGNVTGHVRFTRWRLAGAFVGDEPTWNLPRVQIEEMVR